MNIEQMKAAISGMPIPKLVEMYPAATADQKFLILGEIDSQKKMMAEQAANNTPEGSVEQDIMQEATGIAAAQNMMNRPVSEMEMASRFAGIPSQLPENQPEISPEELMAAGGVASLDAGRMDLAEGGIIAFQEGGGVGRIPSYATTDIRGGLLPERPSGFTRFSMNQFPFESSPFDPTGDLQQDFLRLSELEQKRLGVGMNQEPFTAADLIEYERLKARYQEEAKKEKLPEVETPKLKDIQVTDKKPETEIITEAPKSIFESSRAPDLDQMFKEEDLTGLAEKESERFKEMLGEDEVTKEARERLAKREDRIKEREGALTGESLAEAGFAMMQSQSPFFLQAAGEAGTRGLKAYTEGKREINKLRDVSDQLSMDINKVERAEKTAAAKFGLESEERRRATNEKNRLERDKAKIDMYKTDIATNLAERKIAATEKYYESLSGNSRARMAETIRKAKLSVMESEEYRQARRQLEKKYGGRTDDINYQREAQTLYNTFLSMMLPDVAYGDDTSNNTNILSADDLLGDI